MLDGLGAKARHGIAGDRAESYIGRPYSIRLIAIGEAVKYQPGV